MKITEDNLNEIIDLLNDLICDEDLLTRTERLDLVRAVAAIGAMKARVAIVSSQKSSSIKKSGEKKEKKEKVIDPRFPNAGIPWNDNDESMLREVLEPIPEEEIGEHLFWLAEKLGRTPYSVACKIAQIKKLPAEWKDSFRKISDRIRDSKMTIGEYIQAKGHE
ncbi:DNA-binding protein [Klebsiella oxytoca]|uniref:DNA-binding protein n=1 Tax=Klebsiella oxytoca TaxID=571 RepID=UPI001CCF6680|nr:DNA-binding protein [Klebsiella oxytoca]MBZ7261745.1 DNA-binding protein [Klebsiella oxytoca]